MANLAVVFHSVCGNTYLMANCFADSLHRLGHNVLLARVPDPTYESLSLKFPASREYREPLLLLPVIESAEPLLPMDGILLGSPTYYGCVSAQIKQFMDSFSPVWAEAKMAGKYFGCFASSGDIYGGAELCMQVMNTFAQHMGMIPVPVPCNLNGTPQPAYGIAHASGPLADQRLTEGTRQAIQSYAKAWTSLLKK